MGKKVVALGSVLAGGPLLKTAGLVGQIRVNLAGGKWSRSHSVCKRAAGHRGETPSGASPGKGSSPRVFPSSTLSITHRNCQGPNPRKSFRQILKAIPNIRPISSPNPYLHGHVGLLPLELLGERLDTWTEHMNTASDMGSRGEHREFGSLSTCVYLSCPC